MTPAPLDTGQNLRPANPASLCLIHYFMSTAKKITLPASPQEAALDQLKRRETVEVSSLAQLAKSHNEPIGAKIYLYDKVWHFRGRRLTPAETQEVKRLLEKAVPPRKENGSGEYDFDAPGYLEQRDTFKRHARAKCLWLAFPDLFQKAAQEANAAVGDLEAITKFVESQALADEALETLFGVATTTPVALVELTGFISGSNSPKS